MGIKTMSLSRMVVIFAYFGLATFGISGLTLGLCLWYYGVQTMAQYTLLPRFHPLWQTALKVSLIAFPLSVVYLVAIVHLMKVF